MDVFISWSGERSRNVAEVLKVWLKQVIQAVKLAMSAADILAGAGWNREIAKHLSETKFGIICVTRENLEEPWLQVEAGALAKTVDEATFVCPYLFGLTELAPTNPLFQFQFKQATEAGTSDLVRAMHCRPSCHNPDHQPNRRGSERSFQEVVAGAG